LRKENDIPSTKENENTEEFLLLKSGSKYHKVLIEEILFIESLKDYIKVHVVNDKRIVTKYKISDIEEKLHNGFLRVHRSYIINTSKISAFTINDIEISSTEIPIGASYKEKVISFLNQWK